MTYEGHLFLSNCSKIDVHIINAANNSDKKFCFLEDSISIFFAFQRFPFANSSYYYEGDLFFQNVQNLMQNSEMQQQVEKRFYFLR